MTVLIMNDFTGIKHQTTVDLVPLKEEDDVSYERALAMQTRRRTFMTIRSMTLWMRSAIILFVLFPLHLFGATEHAGRGFPLPLDSYSDANGGILNVLFHRAQVEPFNLVATIIFFLAILHTFAAPVFTRLSHKFERHHRNNVGASEEVSFKAELFHFLGEVEAIFGLWVIPLLLLITLNKDWQTAKHYLTGLNFTEPLFVVIIMAIAASKPVLKLAEQVMSVFARIGGGSPSAWWFGILTIGPLLGSFITEPAAMTITALLLATRFYDFQPTSRFAYATLGLLFVNVSVGGTLTPFAAPPVLMVAGKWNWDIAHMFSHFGWKAVIGILVANALYFLLFRRELKELKPPAPAASSGDASEPPIPFGVTAVHIAFMVWTVANAHYPVLFIGGFLFYLAFTQATGHHQHEMSLRQPLLVGFFLAGLVVHGGLQSWWIEPVLSSLGSTALFLGAIILTAFNDNAAITYLASLVPTFGPELKYAVVAGAVAGGGLTVIANAPNPAGQSLLSKYFPDGVSPLKLLLGALIPTLIVAACFHLFR